MELINHCFKKEILGIDDTKVKENQQQVVIADINIPFMSMVNFIIKLTIAMIPAGIFLYVIGFIIIGLLAGTIHY